MGQEIDWQRIYLDIFNAQAINIKLTLDCKLSTEKGEDNNRMEKFYAFYTVKSTVCCAEKKFGFLLD
jgi:hypothetical protein